VGLEIETISSGNSIHGTTSFVSVFKANALGVHFARLKLLFGNMGFYIFIQQRFRA
jgi:hypothetical protein